MKAIALPRPALVTKTRCIVAVWLTAPRPWPRGHSNVGTRPRPAPVASEVAMAAVPSRFQPLVDATQAVAQRFASAGHELHLVGGPVRDALLGLDPTASPDLDYATDATPEETLALVTGWADATWTQGQQFGTIGFQVDGVRHEVTTYRAEAYSPD